MKKNSNSSLFFSASSEGNLDDKTLIEKANKLLEEVYPAHDAIYSPRIDQFRKQVLNQLNKVSFPLTSIEQKEIIDFIQSLQTIQSYEKKEIVQVCKIDTLTSKPPVYINIFSHNSFGSSASFSHIGDVKVVLEYLNQYAQEELTAERISVLKQLMHQYLTLHYQDEIYTKIPLLDLDKELSFPQLMDNLMVVHQPTKEQRKEEILTKSQQSLSNSDPLWSQTSENTFANYQKKSIEVKDFFKNGKTGLQFEFKQIIIHGRAGIGKTVLCHQICHAWSQPNGLWQDQFEWVFYLPLRELNQKIEGYGVTIEDAICYLFFGRPTAHGFTPTILHQVLESLQGKVLFILDGYDEFKVDSPFQQAVKQLLSIHTKAYVLVTARPFYTPNHTFPQNLELMGFRPQKIQEYIKIYFEKATAIQQQLGDWLSAPEHGPIYTLVHVPILLSLLCHLWDDPRQKKQLMDQSSFTMTQLYMMLVNQLWWRYREEKQTQTTQSTEWKQSNSNLLRQFFQQLAFESLEKDEVKFEVTTLCATGYKVFKDFYQLEEAIDFEYYLKRVLETGFFYKEGLGDRTRESYYFLHKTFQEYFAAQYFAKCFVEKKNIEGLSVQTLISQYKYNPNYEEVWCFLAGLLANNPNHLKEFYLLIAPVLDKSFNLYHLLLSMECLAEGQLLNCSEALQLMTTCADYLHAVVEEIELKKEEKDRIKSAELEEDLIKLMKFFLYHKNILKQKIIFNALLECFKKKQGRDVYFYQENIFPKINREDFTCEKESRFGLLECMIDYSPERVWNELKDEFSKGGLLYCDTSLLKLFPHYPAEVLAIVKKTYRVSHYDLYSNVTTQLLKLLAKDFPEEILNLIKTFPLNSKDDLGTNFIKVMDAIAMVYSNVEQVIFIIRPFFSKRASMTRNGAFGTLIVLWKKHPQPVLNYLISELNNFDVSLRYLVNLALEKIQEKDPQTMLISLKKLIQSGSMEMKYHSMTLLDSYCKNSPDEVLATLLPQKESNQALIFFTIFKLLIILAEQPTKELLRVAELDEHAHTSNPLLIVEKIMNRKCVSILNDLMKNFNSDNSLNRRAAGELLEILLKYIPTETFQAINEFIRHTPLIKDRVLNNLITLLNNVASTHSKEIIFILEFLLEEKSGAQWECASSLLHALCDYAPKDLLSNILIPIIEGNKLDSRIEVVIVDLLKKLVCSQYMPALTVFKSLFKKTDCVPAYLYHALAEMAKHYPIEVLEMIRSISLPDLSEGEWPNYFSVLTEIARLKPVEVYDYIKPTFHMLIDKVKIFASRREIASTELCFPPLISLSKCASYLLDTDQDFILQEFEPFLFSKNDNLKLCAHTVLEQMTATLSQKTCQLMVRLILQNSAYFIKNCLGEILVNMSKFHPEQGLNLLYKALNLNTEISRIENTHVLHQKGILDVLRVLASHYFKEVMHLIEIWVVAENDLELIDYINLMLIEPLIEDGYEKNLLAFFKPKLFDKTTQPKVKEIAARILSALDVTFLLDSWDFNLEDARTSEYLFASAPLSSLIKKAEKQPNSKTLFELIVNKILKEKVESYIYEDKIFVVLNNENIVFKFPDPEAKKLFIDCDNKLKNQLHLTFYRKPEFEKTDEHISTNVLDL